MRLPRKVRPQSSQRGLRHAAETSNASPRLSTHPPQSRLLFPFRRASQWARAPIAALRSWSLGLMSVAEHVTRCCWLHAGHGTHIHPRYLRCPHVPVSYKLDVHSPRLNGE